MMKTSSLKSCYISRVDKILFPRSPFILSTRDKKSSGSLTLYLVLILRSAKMLESFLFRLAAGYSDCYYYKAVAAGS